LDSHASRQGRRVFRFETSRVDNPKLKTQQSSRSLSTVTGYPWSIINKSKLFTDQPIEQGRFTNVRSADDYNGWQLRCLAIHRQAVMRPLSSIT
jgi:hypothetical protein